MKKFTDFELLAILEENGKDPSYKNLCILKEGLENGSITMVDDEKEQTVKPSEEVVDAIEEKTDDDLDDLFDDEIEEAEPKPVVNAYDKSNVEKTVKAIQESAYRYRTSKIIKSFLIEDCKVEAKELEFLTEATENLTISSVINNLFSNITEKLSAIDTSPIDKSRGDIASLKDLSAMQNVISQLEAMIERSNMFLPECKEVISTIVKAMVNLNQFSAVFKDAYRNKKTLMILKYQSIVLSLISVISYLLSAMVMITSNGPELRKTIQIEKIAPIKTLEDFNNSVSNGEFKTIARDVNVLREYYCELSVEKMGKLTEAADTLSMVIDGVKNFISNIDKGGRVSNMLYKISGVLILLFSLRDSFYTIFRLKTKVSDMLQGIQNFSNINLGGQLNKLLQFTNKFRYDIEGASEMTDREIEDDNKRLNIEVRNLQQRPIEKVVEPEQDLTPTVDSSMGDFTFDF